jgi:hypothetical protein
MRPDPGPAPISEDELVHILEGAPDLEADFSEDLHHVTPPHPIRWSAREREGMHLLNGVLLAWFSAMSGALLCGFADPWKVVVGIGVGGVVVILLALIAATPES